MDPVWRSALWQQFGAAIAMLDHALVACPDALWTQRLWPTPPPPPLPAQFAEFWYLAFHTTVWLDIYLSGLPEGEFAPPAPFPPGEIDSVDVLPAQPYTKETIRTYLAATRQSCQTTLLALTAERARQPVSYPWSRGQVITYLELQLRNLRHVQEHAAQLSLFLGQHATPNKEIRWVSRATGGPEDITG